MSYVVKEYVVRVEHREDCQRNRLCGPACVRVKGGYEVDFRLRFPASRRIERHRERVPAEWAKSKSKAERWAAEREVHWLKRGPEEERKRDEVADLTVRALAEEWIEERKALAMDSVLDEEPSLKRHVLPLLGGKKVAEVRPRHARELVLALRRTPSVKGGFLAPRTVRGLYFLLRQVFQYAVIQDYLPGNPILVDRSVLPKRIDKDPSWRSSAVFTSEEVERLISDERILHERRVRYAIEFLASLRTGQASALRFCDYEPLVEPLGRLNSSRTYDSRVKKVKDRTKTDAVHAIPVHPTLAKVLAAWKLSGWKRWRGRAPGPGDLILPTKDGNPRDARKALTQFHRDLATLGLRTRRHYDTRRTFISLALDGGARKDLVEQLTHPAPKDSFDLYRTAAWPALCEQVRCVKVGLREGVLVAFSAPDFGANEALAEAART